MLRVRRPDKFSRRVASGTVGFGVSLVVAVAIAEIPDAVLRQPVLDNRRVLLVLRRLPQARGVHQPEIRAFGIDSHRAVRGDTCPGRVFRLFLRNRVELSRGDVILEICRVAVVLQPGDDIESEIPVILQAELAELQVLGIERVADCFCDLHRQFLHVEEFRPGALLRIDHVILRPP